VDAAKAQRLHLNGSPRNSILSSFVYAARPAQRFQATHVEDAL
jgi:hypothetical protein